ncbi:MAG: inorganic triphosphatase YgiF [Myxococcota bacterium]|jgi:inorganic triphosphatase YgiF
MSRHITEREVKLRLPDEAAWAAVRLALSPPVRVLRQVNTYFDTPSGRLRERRDLMVRVREVDGRQWVQVKDRISANDGLLTSRERETELTPSAWQSVHRAVTALTALDNPLCQQLAVEVQDSLHPLGSVINTREVFDLGDGYLAEVDRTELPGGRVDYEVEIELRAEHHTTEGAIAAVEAAAGQALTGGFSTPKYGRFLDALEDATRLE